MRDPFAEIASDPRLQRYAWAILGGHVIVALYFLNTNTLSLLLARNEPICWPHFADCWQIRFDSIEPIRFLLAGYGVLIVFAGVQLGRAKWRSWWWLLLCANLYLFGLVSLDYRYRANEFYMLFWLNLVFLFSPAKRWSVPLVLVSFYVWAGTLKLNREWMSGAVLYHPLWLIPSGLTAAACVYVVVLEMVMSWGLLARRRSIRLGALAQFALFHVQSLSQIHWFYPALMGTMLYWFLLPELDGNPSDVSIKRLFTGRAPLAGYAVMGTFAAFQLAPHLYRGDPALTGQGRALALHMFQARQICEITGIVHWRDRPPTEIDLRMPTLPPRTICDPIVYFNRIQNICRSRRDDPAFIDVDFIMKVRRTTDPSFRTVVDEAMFCGKNYRYSPVFDNKWLR
ncbi:MAG TPA: hypothetical protein VN700_09405 [Vicinamibacterales bacterium]|nr:hypothetical protein [Vicinamibacterales bacterium]